MRNCVVTDERKTDTIIVRFSEIEALQKMPDDAFREAVNLMFTQALTGVQQKSDNLLIDVWLGSIYPNQLNALEGYHASIRNGKAGGRPETVPHKEVQKLFEQGLSNTAMADKLHCSESTIERKLRELGLSRRGTQTVNRTTSTDESVNLADSGQEMTEDELPF